MSVKSTLIKLSWLLTSQFGIDPQRFFRALRGLPAFLRDYGQFRKSYVGLMHLMPCLHDRYEECGTTHSEYFWQDLLVARIIFENNPEKHVDIGSRIDGFVAHVASFRQIEVFDVRPITASIPGVIFIQADFTETMEGMSGYCDSLSCLHVLEHFGLGRYGDTVDPNGFEIGIANMARLLRREGVFYLSVPIGVERVEFNANRVFDPRRIVFLCEQASLWLTSLIIISKNGGLSQVDISDNEYLSILAQESYSLGIFTFIKNELP